MERATTQLSFKKAVLKSVPLALSHRCLPEESTMHVHVIAAEGARASPAAGAMAVGCSWLP